MFGFFRWWRAKRAVPGGHTHAFVHLATVEGTEIWDCACGAREKRRRGPSGTELLPVVGQTSVENALVHYGTDRS